jgi:two-component system, OmpR family, alkaline phosphatase synthesis response regulator PhoP
MEKKRILLVEDEENILDTLLLNFESEGYDVICAKDGHKALKYFNSTKFDLVLLDIMIPEINGIDVCKNIRIENKNIPIIFLSAKSSGIDRVEGLKVGADDYIVKPFNLEELLLRIKLHIKKNEKTQNQEIDTIFEFNDFKVDFENYELYQKGKLLTVLTKKECQMLRLLVDNKNKVVSRDQILENIWGYEAYPTARTIDNFLMNLRKLFETNPKEPVHFISVRGVGYKFVL